MISMNGTAAAAAGLCCVVAATAFAGPELISFPADYEKHVLYATIDRPDNKQYRELYATPGAIEAAKKGEPLPHGTVLTLVQYAAKLDEKGNPARDANGRFIKDKLVAFTVMQKGKGWGAEYPGTLRNGEWEYRAFRADKSPNAAAKLENCFKCHKPLEARLDFVFTYDRMKAAR